MEIGSPPPMRGKVLVVVPLDFCRRITPAYAGKSSCTCLRHRCRWDHPRLCGEKNRSYLRRRAGRGSPPPMRGKVLSLCEFVQRAGITPAYAGKRQEPVGTARVCTDHPRLCGEKSSRKYVIMHNLGSPPPMRGKDAHMLVSCGIARITPAYAGKSRFM